MANIVMLVVGSRGDVQPAIVLGKALQRSGHTVTLQAGSNFLRWIESHGLRAVDNDIDYLQEFHSTAGYLAMEAGDNMIEMEAIMRSVLDKPAFRDLNKKMYEAAIGADAIICIDNVQVGMAIAEKLGIRHIELHYSPTTCVAKNANGDYVFNPPRPLLSDHNNKFREDVLGIPAQNSDDYDRRFADLPLVQACSREFFPVDTSSLPPNIHISGFFFMDDDQGWQPPPHLQEFLERGPPPLSIGFGSMTLRNQRETAELVLRALRLCGQRAVLLSGWSRIGADLSLPDSVCCVDDVPHDWLFPHVAAAVHHAGAGTTASATRAGIPSLTVPFWFDQFFWSERVHALGLGPEPLPRNRLTAEALAERIETMLGDSGMLQRASAIGQRMRQEPGITGAVEVINRHLAG